MEQKFFLAEKIFILLYFPILTVERIISLVPFFSKTAAVYDPLEYYMTVLSILSILGAYLYLALTFKKAWKDPSLRHFSIAAGILLVSGMVHTAGTIAPIQFAAYGMLLVAMALHTVMSIKKEGRPFHKWLAFLYTLAFSMAIPVVYRATLRYGTFFHILESAVSLLLVLAFTVMLIEFFQNSGENRYSIYPFAIALFGDAAVLLLRLPEMINTFVAIFYAVTVALYLLASIISRKDAA